MFLLLYAIILNELNSKIKLQHINKIKPTQIFRIIILGGGVTFLNMSHMMNLIFKNYKRHN